MQYFPTKGGLIAQEEVSNFKYLKRLMKGKTINMEKEKKVKTVNEALGREPFYPNELKIPIIDLIGKTFLIEDARYIHEWTNSQFGIHPLVLIKGVLQDKENKNVVFTTISSGKVIVKKIKQLLDKELLPTMGTLVKNKRYYDLV